MSLVSGAADLYLPMIKWPNFGGC